MISLCSFLSVFKLGKKINFCRDGFYLVFVTGVNDHVAKQLTTLATAVDEPQDGVATRL